MAGSKPVVDIKSGALFPFPFLVLGAVVLVAGVAVVTTQFLLSIFLMLTAGIILTAHEGTEIDPSKNTYREYQSYLFIKKGKVTEYDQIEKIFVNATKVSQRMYTAHTSNSSTFSNVEYNAYLKFTDGVKIFLLSKKNKARLLARLEKVARALNIPVTDSTLQR